MVSLFKTNLMKLLEIKMKALDDYIPGEDLTAYW